MIQITEKKKGKKSEHEGRQEGKTNERRKASFLNSLDGSFTSFNATGVPSPESENVQSTKNEKKEKKLQSPVQTSPKFPSKQNNLRNHLTNAEITFSNFEQDFDVRELWNNS